MIEADGVLPRAREKMIQRQVIREHEIGIRADFGDAYTGDAYIGKAKRGKVVLLP